MEKETKTTEVAKETKISPSQTIKAFGGQIKRLERAKLLKKEDIETLKELHKKAVLQFMGGELEL